MGHPREGPRPARPNAGVVVRDRFPDKFLDAHEALFAARHDKSGDIRDRNRWSARPSSQPGVDADAVFAEIKQSLAR